MGWRPGAGNASTHFSPSWGTAKTTHTVIPCSFHHQRFPWVPSIVMYFCFTKKQHNIMTNIILVFVARFREVLLGRLARALALKEETEVSPAEWLNAEAKKRQALQEGGTLR